MKIYTTTTKKTRKTRVKNKMIKRKINSLTTKKGTCRRQMEEEDKGRLTEEDKRRRKKNFEEHIFDSVTMPLLQPSPFLC
jgi:hypothetical protein